MNPVERSLSVAAQAEGDFTAAVYARLFAEHPETEEMFWRDTDGSIRGEMLARVIEAMLDYAERRYVSPGLIRTEVIRHANEIDTPPELFTAFFGVVRDTVRSACGTQWDADMERSWSEMVDGMSGYVTRAEAS